MTYLERPNYNLLSYCSFSSPLLALLKRYLDVNQFEKESIPALELLLEINCKLTKSQLCIKQICLPSIKSNVSKNKNELLKTCLGNKISKTGPYCNPFQSCPSLSSFIFASLFIKSFNVLSGYLMFYSTWWQVPAQVFEFDKLLYTASLAFPA